MNRYLITYRVKHAPTDWGRWRVTKEGQYMIVVLEQFKEENPNAEGCCITQIIEE